MPANQYSSQECADIFSESGSTLIGFIPIRRGIVGKEVLLPTSEKIHSTDRAIWACKMCSSRRESIVKSALSTKKFTCHSCGGKQGRGAITFDSFVTNLQNIGWEINDVRGNYKDTKSCLKVKCSNKHDVLSYSYNKLQQGVKCATCLEIELRASNMIKAKNDYERLGYTLLESEYTLTHKPMKTLCNCGKEFLVSHSNVKAKIKNGQTSGVCDACVGRWRYIDVKEFVEKKGCEIISINQKGYDTYDYSNPPEQGCDAAGVINADFINYKCFCKNKDIATTSWRSFRDGVRCDKCTQEKRMETCIRVYGCPNAAQSPEVQKRTRETYTKIFGVDHNMKTPECKNKAIQTNMSNHGGQHNLTEKSLRDAAANANFLKTGFTHPLKNPALRSQIIEDCLKKHGNKCYVVSDAGKQHMTEKYGAPYPSQVPEIVHKIMKKAFSTKEYIFPSGRIEMIQGYEHFALNDLIDFGVNEDDILVGENVPYIDYFFSDEVRTDGASSSATPTPIPTPPKMRRYFPDIYVKARDARCALIIEVKSKYTLERDLEKNIAKFSTVNEQYSDGETLFTLWVYDRNGTRMEFSNPSIEDTTTNFQM